METNLINKIKDFAETKTHKVRCPNCNELSNAVIDDTKQGFRIKLLKRQVLILTCSNCKHAQRVKIPKGWKCVVCSHKNV